MNTVNTSKVISSNKTNGVARDKGQTHVVELKAGKWTVIFTHLSDCGCNYCNGQYDYLVK